MHGLLQNVRYSLRQLRKTPGFTATAVLTLALGIGANVAVFSVMNAVLLNPSGIPHPARVVALRVRYSIADLKNIAMSSPDFGDAAAGKNIFSSTAVLSSGDFNYSDGAQPQRLVGAHVSWQWFNVFQARPILGRIFRPEEDQPGANHEAVLSYKAWKDRFGGDPGIVGRSLTLNAQQYRVIGVMGPDFNWPNNAEVWVPLGLPPAQYQDQHYRYNEYLFAVARLKPGVTLQQANAYLAMKTQENIASEGSDSFGKSAGWGMFCEPLIELVSGPLQRPLTVLMIAVGIILLIACANIAGLQLARLSAKQKEISIQIALGASRARLIQQAFIESLLLAAGGVALGLAMANALIPLLLLAAPPSLIENISVQIHGPVLAFVAGVGVLCAILCGTVPAWQMTRVHWFQTLQEGGRSDTAGKSRQRLRSSLVVSEIALAMLLLVGAGLLIRSLQQLERVETGFDPHGLMSAALTLPSTTYKTDAQKAAFATAMEEQLKNIPGVSDAALVDALPFTGNGGSGSFELEGHPIGPDNPGAHGNIRYVSPDYFATLRIPQVQGRIFTSDDRLNTVPVAVVDETLAKQYWPNQDPIGQHIRRGTNQPWVTIVGIVAHARASSLESDTQEGFFYQPIAQAPASDFNIVVRTRSANPASVASAMQAAARAVDPNEPIYDLKTMEQRVNESLIGRRFLVVLLAVFAGLALLLAALGLYGVIGYGVKMRTRELGIRMALGAQRGDVLRLVLGNGIRLAATGLVLGLAATFVAGRAIASLLYKVSLFNPLTLAATSLLLSATVLLASYLPARRASKLDPMTTLREE